MGDVPHAWTTTDFRAGDGYVMKVRHYAASGAPGGAAGGVPKGEVVCLHGIQSHAGWYEYSCTELSRRGYNVSFIDRRGSGANMEARGDCPSFRRLVDDVAEFLTSLTRTVVRDKQVTPLPVFLSGVSWGGKIAVALERRHPGLVDGLILLCPGFFPRIHPTIGQRLNIFFTRLVRPRTLFPIPLSDPELFTQTPRWLDFLRGDSLSLRQASARFMIESARLDAYLRFSAKYVHVPALLLLAEHDRIIHNGRTRAFIEKFATDDKTIKEYAGAHHTLEFEPDPSAFVADIVEWLNRHQRPKTIPPA